MKTAYIIYKKDKHTTAIEAVVGVEQARAKSEKNRGILVTHWKRLEKMNNNTIMAIYNTIADQFNFPPITRRFETKTIGAKRTFKALEDYYGVQARLHAQSFTKITHTPSSAVKKVKGDNGQMINAYRSTGINLPPRGYTKTPRAGNKADTVLRLLLRPNGATLNELAEKSGLSRHEVRVYLHYVNKYLGYGVETIEYQPGDNRFRAYKGAE